MLASAGAVCFCFDVLWMVVQGGEPSFRAEPFCVWPSHSHVVEAITLGGGGGTHMSTAMLRF